MYKNQFTPWSDKELEILKLYSTHTVYQLMELLPNRTKSSIQHKGERLGYSKGISKSNLNRARQFNLPDIIDDPRLAWLIGTYTGDGFVTGKYSTIGLTSIDIELCEYYRSCISSIYNDKTILNIEIKIRTPEEANRYSKKILAKKTAYIFRCGGTVLGRWIKSITNKKSIIPTQIKMANVNIKKAYLAAIFDTEGSITKSGSFVAYIGMGETSKTLMIDIKELSDSLGLKTSELKFEPSSKSWRLRFNMKSLVEAGIKDFMVSKRKINKIDEYIKNILKY